MQFDSNDKRVHKTHPTLTQVPPSLAFSMAMVLTLYWPLARLAAARPPEPIPRTRKSHSLEGWGVGAMAKGDCEKWREMDETRFTAVLAVIAGAAAAAAKMERGKSEGDSLSASQGYAGRER